VVAVFGIAFAVLLTGNSTPSGSGHHKHDALAAASPPGATAPAVSASPSPSSSSHKPTAKNSPPSSPAPNSTPPSPNPTPQAAKPNPAGTVRLAASVSAQSWNNQGGGWVTFQVQDTGSAATGQVTVSIALPAGASMTGSGGGGHGGGDAVLTPFDGNGWNCQATSTGATCTHAGLSAGSQARGDIFFTVSGSSTCGQPVDLTAASGSASASAHSTVSC